MDDVIGSGCLLYLSDCGSLLYLELIIVEVLCICVIVLLFFFYKFICDMFFGGYDVLKDIMLIINIWVIYYDFDEWDKFEVFNFECFLDL